MILETGQWSTKSGQPAAFPAQLDSPSTLIIAFGSSNLIDDDTPLRALANRFPSSKLVGCSTSGEIFGTTVSDDTLSVALLKFEGTEVRTAYAPVADPSQSHAAGVTLAHSLSGNGLKGVLVLSDGLGVNGSELVRGLNSVLPEDVVVTGGLAGDGDRFQRTWVLKDGHAASGYITAVGFYGDRIQLGHGSKGGWDLFGPERRVTKSKGNILYELDGKPALELYKEYLGELASGLPATALLFPLAIRGGSGEEKSIVRTILSVNEADQSLTFAGDIPEGARGQLMRANFDRLIQGAGEAAQLARPGAGGPVLSLAISCVGRRLILGERTEEELEASLDALPRGAKQIGFYSYGEISPFGSGHCDLHNQTMTLTTLREAA